MSTPATDGGAAGLLTSLRRVLSALVGIVQTRVELFATEIEEQRIFAVQLVLLSFLALFFFCLAVIFGTVAVVIAYWGKNPAAVCGGFAAFYLVLTFVLGMLWRARIKARPRFLAGTIAELARDREELRP